MKNYLVIIIFFTTFCGFSQSISKQVIGSSGLTQTTNQSQIAWTLGEPIVGLMTAEDGSVQLGNGYFPSLDMETLNTEVQELNLDIKLYPNPVTETLFITHPEYNDFQVNITSMTGKLIYSGIQQKDQGFNMDSYPRGIYLVTISPENSARSNTYKIIKK
jgi:hypothetical protein